MFEKTRATSLELNPGSSIAYSSIGNLVMTQTENNKPRHRHRIHGNLRYLLMLMALIVVGGCLIAPRHPTEGQTAPYYGIFPGRVQVQTDYYQGIYPGKDLGKRF